MQQRTYSYPFGSWAGKAIQWFIITFLIVALLFDVFGALYHLVNETATSYDLVRLAAALILGLIIWSYATNLYPNVTETEEGLLIQFFWSHLLLRWEDILQVNEAGKVGFKTWVVEARKLSPLHRLYGLLYLRRLRPAFVIFSNLEDHMTLIHEIERHIGL